MRSESVNSNQGLLAGARDPHRALHLRLGGVRRELGLAAVGRDARPAVGVRRGADRDRRRAGAAAQRDRATHAAGDLAPRLYA